MSKHSSERTRMSAWQICYRILMLSIALLSTANADTALKKSEHNEPTIEAIEGIRLLADENGHYRGTLLVNQHIMPFIIDTGATTTTIPMKFATEASLPFGSQIELTTAGGRSFAKKTVIERLILGNVELQHIDAILSEYVTEVLIGMNTLKYFHINQSDNKLSLLVNHRILTKAGISVGTVEEIGSEVSSTSSTPITKSIACNEKKQCVTQYTNELNKAEP